MHDLKWSPSEKAIARRAFDQAFEREFETIIRNVKKKASRLEQPSDLWGLEHYLTARRKEIDSKYDYRYSVLPMDLARLIREGLLNEQELHGLAVDKLGYIHALSSIPPYSAPGGFEQSQGRCRRISVYSVEFHCAARPGRVARRVGSPPV
jgi:hypothetical protein